MSICPICGQQEPLNKEDVLPQWLRRYATTQGGGANFQGTVSGKPFNAPVPFSVVVPVGKFCNSWMGTTFEEPAKPILVPLIEAWPQTLLPEAQITIAKWVAKTAIIDALLRPERPPDATYHEFRRTGQPPAGSTVLLGRYLSPGANSQMGHRFIKPPPSAGLSGQQLAFLPFTVAFGQLIIVFCLHVEGPTVRTLAEVNGKLLRIWPPVGEPIEWPPPGMDAQEAPDASTWVVAG